MLGIVERGNREREQGVIVDRDRYSEIGSEPAYGRRAHDLRDPQRGRVEHLDLETRGVVEWCHRHAAARQDRG